jgi:hypothetical protein
MPLARELLREISWGKYLWDSRVQVAVATTLAACSMYLHDLLMLSSPLDEHLSLHILKYF